MREAVSRTCMWEGSDVVEGDWRVLKQEARMGGTYLVGIWGSIRASLRDVDLCAAPVPAEAVPGPTSGKLCLKAA